MTTIPPLVVKVSGWVNVYPWPYYLSGLYATRDDADENKLTTTKRVACVYVEGEGHEEY